MSNLSTATKAKNKKLSALRQTAKMKAGAPDLQKKVKAAVAADLQKKVKAAVDASKQEKDYNPRAPQTFKDYNPEKGEKA